MPELFSIGISHKTAPVALREKLALPPAQAKRLMHDLVAGDAIIEAVAVSTCNRTELYLVTGDPVSAEATALTKLSARAQIAPTDLAPRLYTAAGSDAIAQLMRVASGLDSMVIGETEILGQVKRAYQSALEEGVTGALSNRLFRSAIETGKRVQSETALGSGRVSVASIAVDLAASTLGDLAGREALVIGSGANGELTARALAAAGVQAVFIANRRYDRAIGVAKRVGGRAVRLETLPEELASADIVLGSTGSPHTLIGAEEMREVMAQRNQRPLLMIDIAVPRDIDPAVGDIENVTLLDMDDLQASADATLTVRRSESAQAEAIVAESVEQFEQWLLSLNVIPTIKDLREQGERIVELVIAENATQLEQLAPADRQQFETVAMAIVNRMLHEPTLRLKAAAEAGEGYVELQTLRDLFALDGKTEVARPSNVEPDAAGQSDSKLRAIDDRRGGQREAS